MAIAVTTEEITKAKRELDAARKTGDELKIELAIAALDDLLDRFISNTSYA